MKHKLIIPVLLLMAFPVRAQLMSVEANIPASFPDVLADTHIVRICNDKYAVGFLKADMYNYFYASEVDSFQLATSCFSNSHYVRIPNNVIVSDMLCSGNRVYFCGNLGNAGMYGWFDIKGITDSVTVSISAYRSSSLDVIRKMVVPDADSLHPLIIAVGERATDDVILQIKHGFGCMAATLPIWGKTRAGQVDDLILSGDTLLIVGSDKQGGISDMAFYIRRTNWTYLGIMPDIDLMYVYGQPALQAIPMQGTASVLTAEGRLAVAHGTIGSSSSLVRVAYINSPSDMSCAYVHSTSGDRSYLFKSLEFMPQTNEIILTFNEYMHSGRIAFKPSITSPYISTEYTTNLPLVFSTARFRSNGIISAWNRLLEMQRFDPTYVGSLCAPYNPIAIDIPPSYFCTIVNSPVSWGGPVFTPCPLPNPVKPFDIDRTCQY